MTSKLIYAATFAAAVVASSGQAATFDAAFPSGASTINASGGAFFFSDTHFVEQTFTGTGIADLTQLDFGVNLESSVLNGGGSVNFDVIVNGMTVGDFTISDGDGLGQFDLSFGVTDADPLGDDYTIRFDVTADVPAGRGSVSFALQDSFVRFNGDVSAVPLPASIPLLLAGLGALGIVARRKSAA